MFNKYGVKAGIISCHTPKEERAHLLESFEGGEIQVLTNMGVLTEGWDSYQCSAIIMARPTKSGLLFEQILGRCLRKSEEIAPWKTESVFVDIVDAYKSRKQKTLSSVAGSVTVIENDGKTVTEMMEVFQEALQRGIDINTKLSLKEIEDKFVSRDILQEFSLVDEKLSPYKYMAMNTANGQESVIQVPGGVTMRIIENMLGRYDLVWQKGNQRCEISKNIAGYDNAFKISDAYLNYNYGEAREADKPAPINLLKRNQAWHSEPATPGQIAFMQKLHIEFKPGMSKGEATALIDIKLASRKLKKKT
jgi:hypothetical protein